MGSLGAHFQAQPPATIKAAQQAIAALTGIRRSASQVHVFLKKTPSSLRKHGVDFADAVEALFDELAINIEDPDHHDEQGFISISTDPRSGVLVVVYAYRGKNAIRMISARKADRRERRQYEG